MDFDWKKEAHFLEKLQNDAFLLESSYNIRRITILELYQFDVVLLIFWTYWIREFFLSLNMKNFK